MTDPLNVFISPPGGPVSDALRPAPEGPLAGVRVAVKDLIATAGLRTTAGSLILRDWVPRRSAPVVRALLAAGASVAGKTNTHEFAFGTTNDNPHYGPTRNPWNVRRTTGGSSGGSAAAVAAGMVPLALGTDTAGSVRIPAALCGCVGFKPAWGTLSARGVIPLAPSLDTVGVLGASVREVARCHAALSGEAPVATPASLAGIVIGVIEEHAFARSAPGVVAAALEALRQLERRGATVRRLVMPALAQVVDIGVTIVRTEAFAYHRQWFPARRAEYGADVAMALDAGSRIPAAEYRAARGRRAVLARTLRALLDTVDLLVGPTVPLTAFPNSMAWEPVLPGGELPRHSLTRLTYPFSLARLPAISVPCGLDDGLPVGLQIAAASNAGALAAALAFEAARGPWPAPPVSLPPV